MRKAPDGRHVFIWNGSADALADAIAGVVELFNQNDGLVHLDSSGQLTPVSLAKLKEICDVSICGTRLVPSSGRWERQYFSFAFDPKPRPQQPTQHTGLPTAPGPSSEPTAEDLREVYLRGLQVRIPRVVGSVS